MNRRAMLAATLASLSGPALAVSVRSAQAAEPMRVLCLGGSITEIVYALGAGDRVIARDTTSTFPPEVADLPDVGYLRRLSSEGVLSVAPDLILAEHDAGPVEVVDALRKSGVPWISIPDSFGPEGVQKKIAIVGEALGLTAEAERLMAESRESLARAAELAGSVAAGERRKVLFVLSAQGGRIMAGGNETAAEGIIKLAGGVNAVQGFTGYKPMTDEAILAAAPDLILMMDRTGDHAIADADLLAIPALSVSPAARDKAVLRMDGLYLLGFGPRTGQAAQELHAALYPPAKGG